MGVVSGSLRNAPPRPLREFTLPAINQQHLSGASEGPLDSRLLPKAFPFMASHGTKEALTDSWPGPSLWLRAGQDPGESGQGLREKRLHLRYPLESGKHLDFLGKEPGFLGRGGLWKPHSVLLRFGSVIFPLAGVPQ